MGSYIKQRGYLLIAAVILIFIFSIVGSLVALSFIRKGESVGETHQSKQALYIATSALNIAKKALISKTLTCSQITNNANFTNSSILNGQMTVTGNYSDNTTTLSANMSASAGSLTLTNASAFAAEGVIEIGNELITYNSKAGNTLNGLVRGVGGTIAVTHNSGDEVKQDQCTLTATGAYPSFASAKGEHTLQEVLINKLFAFELGTPSILSASQITLRGNSSIINSGVTTGSQNYAGSTMVSGSTIDIQGNAKTYVSNGSGGTTVSSTSSTTNADILDGVSDLTSASLASYYFNSSLATIFGLADHTYNENNIDGVTNKIIWISGDFDLNGSGVLDIGTSSEPVILIVDGNFNMTGNNTINLNGLLYVTGDIDITGNTTIQGDATIASEGSGSLDSEVDLGGNMTINLNPTNLDALTGLSHNIIATSYSRRPYLFHRINI